MSKFVFGLDVGGTTVKMGLFDVDGQVLDKWEIPTRIQNNGENILPDIAKAVNAKMQEKEISISTSLHINTLTISIYATDSFQTMNWLRLSKTALSWYVPIQMPPRVALSCLPMPSTSPSLPQM